MRCLKIAAVAALTFAAAAVPALGAVVINAANTGYSFQIDYAGRVDGTPTPEVSALGTFTFNSLSTDGKTYNFGYSILNDSTVTSRLSGFGFNTNPNPTGAAVTGTFTNVEAGNYPGYGTVDICFNSGGNSCAGGGNGGAWQNTSAIGTFSLTFAEAMASVTFDDFVTRFQAISGVQAGSSGIGVGSVVSGGGGGGPITAPEPGTWLMMLVGFGLVGWTARRRPAPIVQAA